MGTAAAPEAAAPTGFVSSAPRPKRDAGKRNIAADAPTAASASAAALAAMLAGPGNPATVSAVPRAAGLPVSAGRARWGAVRLRTHEPNVFTITWSLWLSVAAPASFSVQAMISLTVGSLRALRAISWIRSNPAFEAARAWSSTLGTLWLRVIAVAAALQGTLSGSPQVIDKPCGVVTSSKAGK